MREESGQGARQLTWALSTCPLTMSKKTLGLAAAIAQLGRETRAGRAPSPGGSWVALETDGKPSGTNFSAAAFVQELECACAVKLTALGTIFLCGVA